MQLFAENTNPLIAKTNLIIHIENKSENEEPSHPSNEKIILQDSCASDVTALVSTDPQALATALQMAESHNALGVKAFKDFTEGIEGKEAAIRHHTTAFNLTVKAEQLKASDSISSLGMVGRKVVRLLRGPK